MDEWMAGLCETMIFIEQVITLRKWQTVTPYTVMHSRNVIYIVID